MNNDLNQIRIFEQVAELKSFTKAAEVLALEKSTVSNKISQLEARLGVRLLQRTTRSVSLTDAGSQYLSYCQQALSTLQSADDYISELSQTPKGKLRVSVPDGLADFWMPSVIGPFLKQYPQVQLEIIQSNKDVDVIKDKFDISLKVMGESVQNSSLIYRQILSSQWALVATAEHIEQYGVPDSIQALKEQPSIGLINQGLEHLNNQFIHWQGQKVTLKHRFAVNSLQSVIAGVKDGLGVGILPINMVNNAIETNQLCDLGKLMALKANADISIKSTALYLVYAARTGQPAKVKAFIDAVMYWSENKQV